MSFAYVDVVRLSSQAGNPDLREMGIRSFAGNITKVERVVHCERRKEPRAFYATGLMTKWPPFAIRILQKRN
jgi:hypothetical protein